MNSATNNVKEDVARRMILCWSVLSLIESHKPITAIHHVREHNEAAQLNVWIDIVRWDALLLTSIGTGKELGPASRQREETFIVNVLDALVDQVEVHVYTFLETHLRKVSDGRDVWMGRGSRQQKAELL